MRECLNEYNNEIKKLNIIKLSEMYKVTNVADLDYMINYIKDIIDNLKDEIDTLCYIEDILDDIYIDMGGLDEN